MATKTPEIGGDTRLGPALAEINITPFVDVVLVLLVILIGFSFLAVGLALGYYLPQGSCEYFACDAALP